MRQMFLVVFVLVTLVSTAQAELMYAFRFSPTTTSVMPGTQTIDIFLDQTGTGLAPDIANLHTIGLGNANFAIESSDSTISFTGITGFVDGAEGGFVSGFFDNLTPGTAVFRQSSLLELGTTGSGTLAASGSSTFSTIRIGTVIFDLSAGQSTTLSTVAFTSGDFGLADPLSPVIDSIAAASFTITAVPEPTSMVLVSLVGVAGVAIRARRRFAKKA